MSAPSPKGRSTPKKLAASTETALPVVTTDTRPVKTLSGAFGTAIGRAPQLSQTGKTLPQIATDKRPVSDVQGTPPPKNSKPGAPIVPRKGHR